MSVVVKRRGVVLNKAQPDQEATPKKATPRRKRSKPKDVSAQAKKKLTSLSETLEKYHGKTDEELVEFVEPDPSKKDSHNYRINDEQREARLVLMHRFLIRKIKPEEIRAQLGIGVTMYYKLKDQLDARMRLDVSKIDVPYLIGDTLAFYDEIRSMSLTISSQTSVKDTRVKLIAMQVALRAEQDKNAFLTSCGVYSAPVVEHIVRGMLTSGNMSLVTDDQGAKVLEAEECLMTITHDLIAYAKANPHNVVDAEVVDAGS